MRLTRVLRAILGTAVTWGAAWCLIFAPLSIPTMKMLMRSDGPHPLSFLQAVWFVVKANGAMAFAMGAVLGTAFALLLLLLSRRASSLQRLSYLGIGALGAVATPAMSVIMFGTGIGLRAMAPLLVLGASTAMASLAIARRAPDRPLGSPNEELRIRSA
jgi:hypothetical protein